MLKKREWTSVQVLKKRKKKRKKKKNEKSK
jgi:hypothetical protein